MKKLWLVFFFAMFSAFSNAEPIFEIGPKLGYFSYNDDKLGNGFTYGFQAGYYIDINQRVRFSYDRFKGKSYKEEEQLVFNEMSEVRDPQFRESAVDLEVTAVYYTTIYRNYYFVDWIRSFEIDTKPMFLEYDYLFNLTNFVISLGIGGGMSQNNITSTSAFTALTSESQGFADSLNNTVNVSSELDDNFIYGATFGVTYNGYWENLTFALEGIYYTGTADGKVTIQNSSSTEIEDFELETKGFGVYFSMNYIFG